MQQEKRQPIAEKEHDRRVILALDLSTKLTGWALWRGEASRPLFGSVPCPGALGQAALIFERWLKDKVVEQGVTEVWVEAPIAARGKTNLATLLRLYGLHVLAAKVAFERGLPFQGVNVGTWRVFFLGAARAPKEIPATRRRAWLKRAAVDECARRGWCVESDDEADALGLLAYVRAAQPHTAEIIQWRPRSAKTASQTYDSPSQQSRLEKSSSPMARRRLTPLLKNTG